MAVSIGFENLAVACLYDNIEHKKREFVSYKHLKTFGRAVQQNLDSMHIENELELSRKDLVIFLCKYDGMFEEEYYNGSLGIFMKAKPIQIINTFASKMDDDFLLAYSKAFSNLNK